MAEVSLRKVNKVYPGDIKAVDDFSLDIIDGEFIVLVGPSGCGKSTTLRMIAGLEDITSGSIRIGEKIVNDVPPKDRDIAMVFQNYALYPHMTVRENMSFGLRLRKYPRKESEERVKEAARILSLDETILDRKPKALSGGQRQRVAVGRAIVRKPSVFLFDEPLSNLDAKLRVQMRVEISRLHTKLGATMIYVTHDQVEAMTMGDRIVVMKDGIIQQIDNPVNLYDHPRNIFVAGFIGTPPMNFFEGKIRTDSGSMMFNAGDGLCLPVHGARVKFLEPYVDQPVIMGLRPEDIGFFLQGQKEDAPRIKARVDVVEPMGMDSYIYLSFGSHRFVSRVDSHRLLNVGELADLPINMSHAHFFYKSTGISI